MNPTLRRCLATLLSVSLSLPSLAFAETPADDVPAGDAAAKAQSPTDAENAYWSGLMHDAPWLERLAFDGSVAEYPLPAIDPDSPELDADGYFTRSQVWEAARACADGFCFEREGQELLLTDSQLNRTLRLKQDLEVIRFSDEYIVLAARTEKMFSEKYPHAEIPPQGVFFISRQDFITMGGQQLPLPVFFMPIEGPGWTGLPAARAITEDENVLEIPNRVGEGVRLLTELFQKVERAEREFYITGITWETVESGRAPAGLVKPKSTKDFGTALSGILPVPNKNAIPARLTDFNRSAAAPGSPVEPVVIKPVPKMFGTWKDWRFPAALWAGRFVALYFAYDAVDWSHLIPPGMLQKIEWSVGLTGAVAIGAAYLRVWKHGDYFAKKYPKAENETLLAKVNRHHKAFLDEFAHLAYVASIRGTSLGLQYSLDYVKDRTVPNRATWIHKIWNETMGYSLRTSNRLAMNWKTWWLGAIVMGMSDSTSVLMDMLIIGPAIAKHYGYTIAGTATAAYIGAEIIRNFVSYFQTGAHGYSEQVKNVYYEGSLEEAKRKLIGQGKDPKDPKNQVALEELTDDAIQHHYKNVSLPLKDEFLYDPTTVVQARMSKLGYGVDATGDGDAEAELKNHHFALESRHWGLVQPSLKRAAQLARDIQRSAPSALGAQVAEALERSGTYTSFWRASLSYIKRSLIGGAVDRDGLKTAMREADDQLVRAKGGELPNPLERLRVRFGGAVRYFKSDSAQAVKDQRMVLFLMSTDSSNMEALRKFFPKSWVERAGSFEAAYLAADLFHRVFQASVRRNDDEIDPKPETIAALAPAVAERMQSAEAPRDPFAAEVYRRGLIVAEKQKQDRELENSKPVPESNFARRQWAQARAAAEAIDENAPMTPKVTAAWNSLYQAYRNAMGDLAMDQDTWTRKTKYRFHVAQSFGGLIGLAIKNPSESPLVYNMVLETTSSLDRSLANPVHSSKQKNMNENERDFYAAKLFTDTFNPLYVRNSVHSTKFVKATSGEFPGLSQFKRIELEGKTDLVSNVNRFTALRLQTLWRNEPDAYRAGKTAWLMRNIPLIPDMFVNGKTYARRVPFLVTFSWFAYQLYGISSPWATWVASIGLGFFMQTMMEVNSRFTRNSDKKAMESVPAKLGYSTVHGFLTNPVGVVSEGVSEPAEAFAAKVLYGPARQILESCERALL